MKEDQECNFVVVDPEDQMFLTILVTDDDVREFSPKIHTLIIFTGEEVAGRLKSVAFVAANKLNFGNRELTITFIDKYQINQAMFQMLAEKYNTIHIDLDEATIEPAPNEPAIPQSYGLQSV